MLICLLITIFILKPYPEDLGIIVIEDAKEEKLIKNSARELSKEEESILYESITDNVKYKKGIGFYAALKI